MQKYVEKWVFSYSGNGFFSTGGLGKNLTFPQGFRKKQNPKFFNSFFLPFPQVAVENFTDRS